MSTTPRGPETRRPVRRDHERRHHLPNDGAAAQFRGQINRSGGRIELLPAGAFKASGTSVLICLFTLNVGPH
uniref:hypothetical protein n=1 Tax=Methylobacterium sp. TaxID=409 RepID=UPI0020C97587|nr:hypothetical protein [Methylobacterium sp.]USU34619.1 hypothetical protein NG677_23635 [Methylobacterium sp.]